MSKKYFECLDEVCKGSVKSYLELVLGLVEKDKPNLEDIKIKKLRAQQ